MNSLLAIQDEEKAEADGVVKGVAIGIVTKNQDDGGMGRIRVRFPWRGNQDESHWARLAVPMAGKERGTWFLPEVGDEVLVAFDRGDIRHPYVVGALWNGKDSPPEANSDGKNDVRKITSRSKHEIIFNDGAQGHIEIHTADEKAKVYLDEHKIEVTDQAGNKIIIDSDQGAITIESKAKISMKSPKIDIQADASMTIKAGGTLTIQGALVQIN